MGRTGLHALRPAEFQGLESGRQIVAADLELIGEFKESGPSQHLAERTGEMVQGWLVDHIAEADRAYAKHVLERANR